MNANSINRMDELMERYPTLAPCRASIQAALDILLDMSRRDGKLLICGNGGSAADCEHIVGELMKSFILPRPATGEVADALQKEFPDGEWRLLQNGVQAISLPSQAAISSAYINDVSAPMVYAQLVHGYAKPGDVLLCLSTSGNSGNVVNAAKVARAKGITTIAMTGAKDSKLSALCDVTIQAPATETFQIQELHLPIYHCLCSALEQALFGQ